MEINNKENIKQNGAYQKTTTIKTTKEDGWNDANYIFGNNIETKKRLFKGNAVSFQYETDDPNITKPFTIITSFILISIGIILSIISVIFKSYFMLFFGIMILITSICFLINSQKYIKKTENEIKNEIKNETK